MNIGIYIAFLIKYLYMFIRLYMHIYNIYIHIPVTRRCTADESCSCAF